MKYSHTAYIAIGSNLENPLEQLRTSIETIDKDNDITVVDTAKIYKTKPYGFKDQPDFINTVIEVRTNLEPFTLLKTLQDIENKQGRKRGIHWGPRVIDLDIILFDELIISEKDLTIPHPFAHDRDFVIIPLNDISPSINIPGQGTVAELSRKFNNHDMMIIR